MNEKKTSENLRKCSRFNGCSINICPLDLEIYLRNRIPGEKTCPFMIKKKHKEQKGIKTLIPYSVLKFIPKSNLKMLNKRNQKRWMALHYIK